MTRRRFREFTDVDYDEVDQEEDYDDFEEVRDYSGFKRRLISFGIAIIAIAVFGGVIWYAYNQGMRAGSEGAAPVILAEDDPVRVRPEDPGGIDVPFQDSLVYNQLAEDGMETEVEQLLPPPEEPVGRPAPEEEAAPGAPVPADGPAADGTAGQDTTETAVPPGEAALTQPEDDGADLPGADALPEPQPLSPPAGEASESAPGQPETTEEPETTEQPATTGGGYRIQLASVRSEDGARTEWDRLRDRHSDQLGDLELSIQRVELDDRGTFYRIQAGPLDQDGARSRCDALESAGQACIVVQP